MSLFTHKHVRDLTRRVYLLECHTGTQEGLDIRPNKNPDHPASHYQVMEGQMIESVQSEVNRLEQENQHLDAKNKRQENTIRDGGDLRKRNKRLVKETWGHLAEANRLAAEVQKLEDGGEVLRHEIQRQGNLRMEQANRIVELSKEVRILRTKLAIRQPEPVFAPCECCTPTREVPGGYYRLCECRRGWVLA